MEHLDQQTLLRVIKELVMIESTASNPAGIQAAYEYMREYVRTSGKAITIEEFESNGKPSFLAYRGQARPERFRVIFNAHVDVVTGQPEQFKPYIKDDTLYGRGVYDMKAAAIVMAQVFCEYVDKLPYAIGFQVVTDEEGFDASGTKHQIEQGVCSDLTICGECGRITGDYEIANEAKGVALLEVQFNGSSTHGAYPWRGDNAALKAAEFVRTLHEHFPIPSTATDKTTVTVTRVETSDTSHSQTPDSASVRLDCRYAPDDSNFQTVSAITDFIHSIDPDATIPHVLGYGLPMFTKSNNPLLLELKAAAEEVEHHVFNFTRRNGTSDGRFYTSIGGEACEFGIAGEHQHGDNEHITLAALQNYLETMRSFLQKTHVVDAVYRFVEASQS